MVQYWHCSKMVHRYQRQSSCSFIQFDNKDFYSSITDNILHQTLKFTKQPTNINKNDLRIINHCYKLLLFSDNKSCKKKTTDSCFEATMGSFDGAEICELVGLYIRSKVEKILSKSNFGLYRDDVLVLLGNFNDKKLAKLGKTSSEYLKIFVLALRLKLISKKHIF